MPWTLRQTRYMFANHPEIARRVVKEPGFRVKHPVNEEARREARKKAAKE